MRDIRKRILSLFVILAMMCSNLPTDILLAEETAVEENSDVLTGELMAEEASLQCDTGQGDISSGNEIIIDDNTDNIETDVPENLSEDVIQEVAVPSNIKEVSNDNDHLYGRISSKNDLPSDVYANFRVFDSNEKNALLESLNNYLANQDLKVDQNAFSVDAGLYNADGSKFIPDCYTTVKIYMDWSTINDNRLFHLKDNGEWEELTYSKYEASEMEPKYIEFGTKSFSPFMFVKTADNKRDTEPKVESNNVVDKKSNNTFLLSSSSNDGEDKTGHLRICKIIKGLPEGEYITKFTVKLWTENDGEKTPASNLLIKDSEEHVYKTNEDGEFVIDLPVKVTSEGSGRFEYDFIIPATLHYNVSETGCDSDVIASVSKTNETGEVMKDSSIDSIWTADCGILPIVADPLYYRTSYPEYAPSLNHQITATYNGSPLSGTFPVLGKNNSITFENGVANVELTIIDSDDPMKIYLPKGTEFKIQVVDHTSKYYSHTDAYSGIVGNDTATANCMSNSHMVHNDQYFYYYDATGKCPSIRYYFYYTVDGRNAQGNWPDMSFLSYKVMEDGTKVYYYDPENGTENEIVVKSGQKVVCACLPQWLNAGIGFRWTPVDNVRLLGGLFGSERLIEGGTVREASTSWGNDGSVITVAYESRAIIGVQKLDDKTNPVDATFALANSNDADRKKYSLTHYDTYTFEGREYSNVYVVNSELKEFDSKDNDTFIQTDESGHFYIVYPCRMNASHGLNESVNYKTYGYNYLWYLYETDCDKDYYAINEYTSFAGDITKYLTVYDNGKEITFYNSFGDLSKRMDPTEFDYDTLQITSSNNISESIAIRNNPYPSVYKSIVGPYVNNDIPFWCSGRVKRAILGSDQKGQCEACENGHSESFTRLP